MQLRAPVHGAGLRGGMNRFFPAVSAPYRMPRQILTPGLTVPRTTPPDVATSKNSGPFIRPLVTAGAVLLPEGRRLALCASVVAAPPIATTPARPDFRI